MRVDAGDPLDDVVLRSYAIGATHMALGWVLTEGLAVDPGTGEVLDLTIRSFDVIRPKAMPPVTVEIVASSDRPRALASDAVFAAVAAAAWNAVTPRRRRAARGIPGGRDACRPYAAPMTVEPVPTPSAPPVAGPYSPAVRAGDWLVLAGQVPLDPTSGHFVDGDASVQIRRVLDNIAAVLRDAGAFVTDIAKTTVFVTDLTDFAAMNAGLRRVLRRPPPGPLHGAGGGAPRRCQGRDRGLGVRPAPIDGDRHGLR